MNISFAVNGFGRIGRLVARVAHSRGHRLVAVNSRATSHTNAHLLEFDSLYGKMNASIEAQENSFTVDGQPVQNFAGNPGEDFSWKDAGATVVIESTGIFTDAKGLQQHTHAGAEKVILTAPSKDDLPTFVVGVNDDTYSGQTLVSNASCTTNCTAPLASVMHECFGIQSALLTTVHAATGDQMIHDGAHKDLRRARSVFESIIPTKTGVASALRQVLPNIADRFDGLALRVPVSVVSAIDVTMTLEKQASKEDILAALMEAASEKLSGILRVENRPLVSVDFRGSTESCVVDGPCTKVHGNTVKLIAWYDNEWAYATRVVDLMEKISA